MKNELIKTDKVTKSELEKIVEMCNKFFSKYLDSTEIIQTSEGFDIESNGHELGSYGIRECEFLSWIYATGVAEPRFSKIIYLKK